MTYKARKSAWITLAILLFVPHVICTLATMLDDRIMNVGERMYVWSHADKYMRRTRRQ